MSNKNFGRAKKEKNGEFYTQYDDIEKEIAAYIEYDTNLFRGKTILCPCDDPEWSNFTKYFIDNFDNFGLRRLISTSYEPDSVYLASGYQNDLFAGPMPLNLVTTGKVLDTDKQGDWVYLEGSGCYSSPEVTAYRDQADFIITNPPFSLFISFLNWVTLANKRFLLIGNINAIGYKAVFKLIMENKLWLGTGIGDMEFK